MDGVNNFQKSSIAVRSPPQHVLNESNCNNCKRVDTNDMVQCDKCDKWFHFECVGVTQAIQEEDWIRKCPIYKILKQEDTVGTSEAGRNCRLKEVRRKEREAEDRDYINKKFEILEQQIDDQSESDQDEGLYSNHVDVSQWVEQHQSQMGKPATKQVPPQAADTAAMATFIEMPIVNKRANVSITRTAQQPYRQQSVPRVKSNTLQISDRQIPVSHDRGAIPVNLNNANQPSYIQPAASRGVQQLPVPNAETAPILRADQLAARHVVSKELPHFSGQPSEWPMFISSYESSTETCGFSNAENLLRLQRCLKGKALEAVTCRLLLPSSVSDVITTLRMLYGRPELIIHTLLQKIRSEPAPKAEKLETLISFALSVQNLCATIEAAGLLAHMNNPSLLQELTDRLPPQIKLNWAVYQQSVPDVTLSTFGNWLFEIAQAASAVIIPSPVSVSINARQEKRQSSEKGYLHTHAGGTKNNQTINDDRKCYLCKKSGHILNSCESFNNMNRNERWNTVKENRLCRKCLGLHNHFRCKYAKQCGTQGCKALHHPLLHGEVRPEVKEGLKPVVNCALHCNAQRRSPQSPLFRIIPVTLRGEKASTNTFAFLDEGSSLTLLDEELAKELELEGTPESLCLRWTADTVREEKDSKIVSLQISGNYHGSRKYRINNVRTVSSLNLPVQSVAAQEMSAKYHHLRGVPIQDYYQAVPRIIIGIDNWKLGIPLQAREGTSHQPAATKTRLGWAVHGFYDQNKAADSNLSSAHYHYNLHMCDCNSDQRMETMVKEFFSLESFGVKKPDIILETSMEKRAREVLETTTIRREHRFETGLLWKYDGVRLPDSLPMAKKRLVCLEKKMQQNHDLAEILKEKIRDYLAKVYARKLLPRELIEPSPRIWYLPIFAVNNPNKPNKVRLVWDAACKVNGISLNSVLMKGPDQLAALPGVIQRFRERRVAICGDIKEMFHQIRIREADQQSQRFLWRDGDQSKEPDIYVMQVMTFGATCSPSSAQYVKNVNALSFAEKYPRASDAIKNNHYVDDWLDSVDTPDEAIELAKRVKEIHKHAGFEIRGWRSNAPEILSALDSVSTTSEAKKDLNISSTIEGEKVLGMWWNTVTDTFSYSLSQRQQSSDLLSGEKRPTKREFLRTLMSVFDPLGLLAFYLVYAKILLQDVWRSSIGWDEKLNDEQFDKWKTWIQLLPQIAQIRIPRWYGIRGDAETIQLHIFVDASEHAFAAIAYFRIVSGDDIHCTLVAAKTKVAPLTPLSIPRLELQAAVLGARLANSIGDSHSIHIQERIFWSDSRTVLCWLQSDHRKYHQFVAHRIGEIMETTKLKEWRWINTKNNEADDGTKWKKLPDLNSSSRWLNGPEFLRLAEPWWPNQTQNVYEVPIEERRAHYIHTVKYYPSVIKVERFSSWHRLLRVQAYVFRYVNNLRCRIHNMAVSVGPITQTELVKGNNELYRRAQFDAYQKEVDILLRNKSLPIDEQVNIPESSPIYRSSPYLDDVGILRMKGRIDASEDVGRNQKRPILLPKGHRVTYLLVMSCHRKYHHHNHETVVNELHQQYVIPGVRQLLKIVRSSCQRCKNQKGLPREPQMANLPTARLASFTRPFSYVGIDYFGPMIVSVGRRTEKRWGVLFTCLTIRAVHIETAHSLTTDSCIMCIRNFIARRGAPIEIRSDNGKNLRGAEAELRRALTEIDQSRLHAEFTTPGSKWLFNPPASPHMGGCWERLVRSIKNTLYQIMPQRNPGDELLRNLLIEVEYIINTRPLTFVSIENADSEALTPNHFLLGSSSGNKPPCEFNDNDIILRKNWRKSQHLANIFWKRWLTEYLPTLTKRTKWFMPVRPIEKGNVVIIVDNNLPRNSWPKGLVIATNLAKDGQVRSAVVQTSSGIYERPAVKLAVLDVQPEKVGKPTSSIEMSQLTGLENVAT